MILACAGSVNKFKNLPAVAVKEICDILLNPGLGKFSSGLHFRK
jgi:hypothetical protein